MCRGKAMKDFQGPDCRFVNFKKGETIYVYYKLIGMSTELWAGSVSAAKHLFSCFSWYFPAIMFCLFFFVQENSSFSPGNTVWWMPFDLEADVKWAAFASNSRHANMGLKTVSFRKICVEGLALQHWNWWLMSYLEAELPISSSETWACTCVYPWGGVILPLVWSC